MNRKPVSHKLQIDDTIIEYTVQRDRRRKTLMHLSVFYGYVAVSAPKHTPNHEIQAIVRRQSGWILDKLAKMSAGSKELSLPELVPGDALPYSGRELPLAVNEAKLVAEKPKQSAAELDAEQRQLEAEVPRQAAKTRQTGRLRTAAEIAVEKVGQLEREQREAAARRAWEEYEVENAKQAAAQREAERRREEIRKARRAALRVSLLKGPATAVTVMARLVRLPIVLYKEYRLAKERAKQVAAERQRLEEERAAQVAAQQEAERQRLEAARIKQATEQEAERQRLESERAKQAAAQREAERQRLEDERAKLVAMMVEQQKREEYWESLGGIEFEQELGKLFKARGYWVEYTPVSGDQGIDLILRKNGKTTVVQCKAQQRPAAPRVVRELYGSMVAYGADDAILACTAGFTDGVIKFARGKPIELISAWHIARMAEESGSATQEIAVDPPICPNDGCGRTLVLRNSRRGRFWGCPRYPTCRGTRDF